MKILPYVFTRPGELRLAEWEDIDFESNLFIVPWHRMKTRKVEPQRPPCAVGPSGCGHIP